MRCGTPASIHQQILRPGREAERGPCSGVHRLGLARFAGGLRGRRSWRWIGRLVTEAARAIDRAQQDLQHVQRCGRCESRWSEPRCRAWHACATGRPIVLSWRRPAQSVQAMSSTTACCERRVRQLAGDAPDGAGAESPVRGGDAFGCVVGRREALRPKAGTPVPPRACRPAGRYPRTPADTSAVSGALASRPRTLVVRRAVCRRRRAR